MAGNVSILQQRSPNALLYDYTLSSAYRSGLVYDPSLALARDADIWEVVRNDAGFAGTIERHNRNVVKEWHVEAAKQSKDEKDKALAGVIEDAIGQIRGFAASLRILCEAAFLGRRYAYIESERRTMSLDGGPEKEWIIPTGLRDVDRRRFHWVPQFSQVAGGRQTMQTTLAFYNSISGQWEDVTPEFRGALIEYVYANSEDRVGYGRGWLEAIYFAHYMKCGTIEKLAIGIDRWSSGLWIGKIDSLRNASTGKTNLDLRNGMRDLMRNMRSEHIAVLQDGDEIEVQETTGTGHQVGMDFIHYWDEAVERLVNGSVRPVGLGGSKTGARAASKTEEDTSEGYAQCERDDMADVLDRDLVGWFLRQPQNRMNIMKLGLEGAKRPRFHMRQEKRQDPKTIADTAQVLMGMGVPLVKHELYKRTGWSAPGPEDETIEAKTIIGANQGFGDFGDPRPPQKDEKSEGAKMHEEIEGVRRMIERMGDRPREMPSMNLTFPETVKHEYKAPDVHVDVHPQPAPPAPIVNVKVEQPPPAVVQFSQEAQEPPSVAVHVPQQAAPVVNVHVPEQTELAGAIRESKSVLASILEFLKLKKPARTIEIKRDEQGRASGASVKEE